MQAHAIEAAEQCGGTFVPEVRELAPLKTVLGAWPSTRQLVFCDEARVGAPVRTEDLKPPSAILIGPEGGFSPPERQALGNLAQAIAISLGPRILRADTAAVAALALWQKAAGDWR